MNQFAAIAEVTLRGLLGRRRTILLLLLAGVPVLVALLARIGGGRLDDAMTPILELAVRAILPLIALVFGTSAIGTEIDDGTAVYLLAKPVSRWTVTLAKALVAGVLSAALTVASVLLTGLLIGGDDPAGLGITFAFALAMTVAAFVYAAAFVALSVVTSRALIVGLVYTLVWEGVLAGILEGTRLFSIREATMSLADALAPARASIDANLDPAAGVALLVIVLVAALVVTTARLRSWEVKGTD